MSSERPSEIVEGGGASRRHGSTAVVVASSSIDVVAESSHVHTSNLTITHTGHVSHDPVYISSPYNIKRAKSQLSCL